MRCFSRRRRNLFTVYADELQNLIVFDSGLEALFSESRKFGVSVVSGTQFLEQFPPQMRAAILAIGTHIFFQLSATDADRIASALDGGKRLGELLKNLPRRNMVVKSGHERWRQALVPNVSEPRADFTDLYNRCRARWARRRADIEAELRARNQQATRSPDEVLNDWE